MAVSGSNVPHSPPNSHLPIAIGDTDKSVIPSVTASNASSFQCGSRERRPRATVIRTIALTQIDVVGGSGHFTVRAAVVPTFLLAAIPWTVTSRIRNKSA
jgi:hypothetical protein